MASTDATSARAGSDFAMSEPEGCAARGKKRAESKYTQKLKSRRAACQVKDCINEVPSKAYHQRYKICAEHATAPHLVLEGRHMRFCQHHGRFHPVAEFDRTYRSCRASLARHRNSQARRLKRQTAARQGSTSSEEDEEHGGSGGSGGSGDITRRLRTRGGGSSGGGASSGATLTTEGAGHLGWLPVAQDSRVPPPPLLDPADLDDKELFMGLLAGTDGSEGVAPAPSSACGVPAPHSSPIEIDDLLNLDILLDEEEHLDFGDWMLTQLDGPAAAAVTVAAAVPEPRTAAALCLPPVPSLPSAPAAALPMPSLDALLASASTVPPPPAPLSPALAGGEPSAAATVAAMAAASAILPNVRSTLDAARAMLRIDLDTAAATAMSPAAAPALPSVFHTPGPSTDGSLVIRASLKLFNTHPDVLPDSLRDALLAMVSSAATYLSANARPGCAHITFEAVLTAAEAQKIISAGAAGLLDAALGAGKALLPPEVAEAPRGRMVAQVGTQVAVLGDGSADACFPLGGGELKAVIPLAVTPATAGQAQPFTALGAGIAGPEDLLVVRRGECVPDLGVLAAGTVADTAGADDGSTYPPSSYTARGLAAGEYVQFSLLSLKPGLHCVEVQRGSLLSPSAPFLVVDDAAAAAELRQLEVDASGVEDVAAFVTAVGVVLDHLRLRTEAPGAANASPAAAARVAPLAARAVAVAAVRRWPALLRLLAPATSSAQVDAGLAPSGLTLLHLVAGSGCTAVAESLAEMWSDHPWACEPAGPLLVTPLHVATALDDGGAMASALTRLVGPDPWFTVRSAAGVTPAELAVATGNSSVAALLGCLGPKATKSAAAADVWLDRKFADESAEEAWRELSRAVADARRGWGAQAAACIALLGAMRGGVGEYPRDGPALSYAAVAVIMAVFAVATMTLRVWAGAV